MLDFLNAIRIALTAIHPLLPVLALVLVLFVPQYLIRRFLPGVWEWAAQLPAKYLDWGKTALKLWQALPSIVLGAGIAALAIPGADVWQQAWGALTGALAPVVHELLKLLSGGKYRGGMPPAADPPSLPARE
jgi:hypothetical protein